ncbi:MAG: response regulator transcription factor [Eubacteriales bacterium]|nr:response regulator transcription factor [Eubacteriales bacterium]
MRLLIAEDERNLNRILTKRLTAEGYTVDSCFDGQEALEYLDVGEFDAVILDIMMPKISGLEVLRTIRKRGDKTPVIILTAKDSISDRVEGLDAGAEDYLVKPFAFEELLARIRVMTRIASGNSTNVFTVCDLSLDINSHTVTRGGKEIALSAKEFDVLEYLMRNNGVVLSREKIENHVWNFDYCGGTNIIDVYIRYLRKKIDDDYDKKLIQTIRGKGYVLREQQ